VNSLRPSGVRLKKAPSAHRDVLAMYNPAPLSDRYSPDRKADLVLAVNAGVISLGLVSIRYSLMIAGFGDCCCRFATGDLRFPKLTLRQTHRRNRGRANPRLRAGLTNDAPIAFNEQS
jgi:hypothetical protein